ncbi:hypothetical protein HY483_02515 [Candidatus Woesearchaeota archaeon]|nr:hypothetical protein [Candidatus Woesearchaeota archaeon]
MKNIFSLFIILLLFVVAVQAVVAVENDTENNSTNASASNEETSKAISIITETETKIMTTPFGAEVRLLQLEAKLEEHILKATRIIELAKTKNASTAELEALLEEAKALKEEVSLIEPTPEDHKVQEFVDAKHDAIELVKDFREKAKTLLDAQDIAKIKTEKFESNTLKSVRESAKQKVREHNAEHLKKVLESSENGNVDATIIEKVKNGELTASEARTKAEEKVKELREQKKGDKIVEIKREVQERANKREQKINNSLEKFESRQKERLDARSANIAKNAPPDVKAKVQERTNSKIQQKIDTARTRASQKISTVEEKAQEKIEKAESKNTEPKVDSNEGVQRAKSR